MTAVSLRDMANALRVLTIDAVQAANSGHPGLPMGMADVVTVLFNDFIHVDPAAPHWADRDRFVLSAGHGAMLLYALAHLLGYPAASTEQLKTFRQLGSRTPGHPELDIAMLVETSTGPLGQGFGNAVGMALAERILHARFGDALVNHYTYVIASDGDMMEGINHESAAIAGHMKLNRLIVLYDDNKISIDGPTDLAMSDDVALRYQSYGWATRHVDGHDTDAIRAALHWAHTQDKPVLLLCRTIIGWGAPTKAGTAKVHGEPLGDDEIAATRAALNWPHAPFIVPDAIKAAWAATTARATAKRGAWDKTLLSVTPDVREDWCNAQEGTLTAAAEKALDDLYHKFLADKPTQATRVSSGQVVSALVPAQPTAVGGSADLTGNTGTYAKGTNIIAAPDYAGRYIHWGVREHGMAAAMNGMALHGGLTVYGSTFMVFSDYCRPALRLAAFMRLRVIFVMTHDSIGVGHDGPTHQPVEHLAALRAIPHLQVLRPADAVETVEAWQLALAHKGPTVLALTRQNVPALSHSVRHHTGNKLSHGGYVLQEEAGATITLVASGSEVSLAVETAKLLAEKGKAARIVSMPCPELFFTQPGDYQDRVLQSGTTMPVVIEAAVDLGWQRIVGAVADPTGLYFGVTDFGASAPYQDVYAARGLTPTAIAAAVLEKIL